MVPLQIAAELEKTLDFYRSGGAPSIGGLAPDLQKDLNIASGLQAYNLFPTAMTLFPVLTPFRNMTPRIQGKGKQSEFKAILGVTGDTIQNVWGTEGQSGVKVNLVTEDIIAVYKTLKLATGITFEQQWAGQGFIDSKATGVVNLLRQFMTNEEKGLLWGQNSTANLAGAFAAGATGACAAPTLSNSAPGVGGAPTGNNAGNIAGATAKAKLTMVTGMGESLPSTEVTQAVSANNYLGITPAARGGFPGLYFNVYTTIGGANSELLQTANMVYSTLSGGGATLVTTGAQVFVSVAGTGAAPPGTDNSANTLAWNGLFTQIYGAAAVGVGIGQPGATVVSALNTLATTGAGTNSLENFLAQMWTNAYADPGWLLMHQRESRVITRTTLGAGTPYYVVPEGAPQNATANFRVSRFVNPITGTEVQCRVHPYFQQGSIIAGSDRLPEWYVPTEIPAPWALDLVQDYTEVDYPPQYSTSPNTGDLWNVEVLLYGTFKLYIPAIFGALDSIVAS